MMLSEGNHHNPMVHVPPWSMFDDPTAGMAYPLPVSGITTGAGDCSPYLLGEAAFAALQRYLPSNESYMPDDSDESDLFDPPIDAYSCDEFRIYEFKVRRCARGRSHDWTECPYAHPGEKARRRDPRKYHYSGTACPDFRKGNCKRGDSCEFAHGVFECWLHPARYRTQPCKDGTSCRRRVCFFAHTPEQLRVLPQQPAPESYDGSPLRHHSLEAYFPKSLISSSPTSTLISPPLSPPSESPPLSPIRRAPAPVGSSVNEVLASLRQLQLSKAKTLFQMGGGFVSPIGGFRAGFCSLPSTPTSAAALGGGSGWCEEEPVERVESGRGLRAKIFEKLSSEGGLEKVEPDLGWVSELVK